MPHFIKSSIVHNGARTAVVKIIGILDGKDLERTNVINLAELGTKIKGVRIDTLKFAVEEKLTLLLWWEGKDPEQFICPLAGRGLFDFEAFGGEHSRNDGKGSGNIQLSTTGCEGKKHFALWLDMMKVED